MDIHRTCLSVKTSWVAVALIIFLARLPVSSRRGTSRGRSDGKLKTTERKYNCRFVAFRLNVVQRGARVQELASSACISAPKEPR